VNDQVTAAGEEAERRIGILLAGGSGSRLYPMTGVINKQLIPVCDKPMIYYPLSTLMLAGIREIIVVSTPEATPVLRESLGDGRQWGLQLHYRVQTVPRGIAEAIILCAGLIGDRPIALILGDNIFFRTSFGDLLRGVSRRVEGATIFALPVNRPEDFGVVQLDDEGRPIALIEKPQQRVGNLAVPGLYFYDHRAGSLAQTLQPSSRGELEITDLNRLYLAEGALTVEMFGRGGVWLDCGTPEALFAASQFVQVIEARSGIKIACPEELALNMGFIDRGDFGALVQAMPNSSYRNYLANLVEERGS